MDQVTIDRLGHRGDGIAPGPVFAARTLPGEVVTGARSGDRIPSPRILTPSPDRVRAPCPHYARCGGCAVQHASDRFVADWKLSLVRDALSARGLPAPIRRLHSSPPGARRRAALRGVRTKSGALVGFAQRASHDLVAVPDCHVLHPRLRAAWPAFEAATRLGASRRTAVRLSVTLTDAGVDLAVQDAKPLDPDLFTAAARLAEDHDLPRLTWNDTLVAERRPPLLQVGPAQVPCPPGAFLQATAEGEAALQAAVTRAVGPAAAVADLFAGIGTFALPLAQSVPVTAVESDLPALAALDHAARHTPGLRHVTVQTRDLFRRPLEPAELRGFDAVVVDPPRAGAEAQATRLAASAVSRLAMVSCNPATLARDLRILSDAGFSLDCIDVIDQFRWSAHVELVAALTRSP